MTDTPQVAVSERALIQRINRRLNHDDQQLRTTRSERARIDLGKYYLLDICRNVILEHHVDPEELGRELKVLREWQAVR